MLIMHRCGACKSAASIFPGGHQDCLVFVIMPTVQHKLGSSIACIVYCMAGQLGTRPSCMPLCKQDVYLHVICHHVMCNRDDPQSFSRFVAHHGLFTKVLCRTMQTDTWCSDSVQHVEAWPLPAGMKFPKDVERVKGNHNLSCEIKSDD